MNTNDSLLNKMNESMSNYSQASFSHWLNHEVFTWKWWLCVFLFIVPLWIWWKTVDRKRLFEIMIFGLFVNVTCSLLDVIGSNFALWEYAIKIIPNVPLFFPIDYIIIPVTYMIIYQKFSRWIPYLIAITINALIFAFIGEPFTVWLKLYVPLHWKYIYSFPIYVFIAIVCKATINWFIKKARV